MYSRVSTEDQAKDEHYSLKTQERVCQRAMDDMDYVLADNGHYSDPGKSGTNMKRPGLQDMLIRVKEDESISAIFVQDTDRLARNVQDHLAIKALLNKHEVKLISVSQPGINDGPEGKMMDLMVAGFSQFQSDITSRKTLKSMEEKFERGGWPTRAPLGYLNSPDPKDPDKRTITTDHSRAPLIAEMFRLYSTGDYSIAEVRDIAYKKGLTTAAGKRLAKSKMFELIRCHFYYGDMHWHGAVRKGNHESIITKEIFDRCQKVLGFNNRYACRRRKHDFLLRGFIFCENCKSRHTAAHHPKKNKSYYYCNRSDDNKNILCKEKYTEVHDLEAQVQDHFDKIVFSIELIQKITDSVKKLYEKHRDVVGSEKKVLMTKKVNLEMKLETAEEKLIDNIISDSTYGRIKARISEQITILEDELYKLDRKKNLKMDVIQETLRLIKNVGDAYNQAKPELKRLYISLFWEHFTVSDRKIAQAVKSPILRALEALGSVSFDKLIKSPIQAENLAPDKVVQISSGLGA